MRCEILKDLRMYTKTDCFKRTILLKGSCHGQLTFYMWKSSFYWVQRHIFCPNPRFPSPSNRAKTENPGTSSALKSGYPEEYVTVKTGYPEEYVTAKSGYRKNTLHPKLATGRIHYTENWLPGRETKTERNLFLDLPILHVRDFFRGFSPVFWRNPLVETTVSSRVQ